MKALLFYLIVFAYSFFCLALITMVEPQYVLCLNAVVFGSMFIWDIRRKKILEREKEEVRAFFES